MFVRAVVRSRIADGGRVLDTRLAGKWVSPMHPEIVKDAPGTCDICGMALVSAEELGYVTPGEVKKPLVVPTTAVLVTGTRAVVYIEVPKKTRPTYEGREVILGPRAGDVYIIRSGLQGHERVVVRGAFRIDSSMQILAKPSMMSMRGESSLFVGAHTEVFRRSLEPLFTAYFALQKSLAGDDLSGAKAAAGDAASALRSANADGIPRAAETIWREEERVLRDNLVAARKAAKPEALRIRFAEIARSILALERAFRHTTEGLHHEVFCPMAFDGLGASWLQNEKEILNPFYGAMMLHCGELRTEFAGVAKGNKGK